MIDLIACAIISFFAGVMFGIIVIAMVSAGGRHEDE